MSTPDDPRPMDGRAPEPAWRRRLRGLRRTRARTRTRERVTLGVLIAAFILVVFWNDIVVSLRSGQQGVYWSRFFGGTQNYVLGEGTHLKFPWDDIVIYNIRLEEAHGTTSLLTRDGMEIRVQWSTRYRVDPAYLPELHRTVGPLYSQKIVVPEVISTLRQILGNYTAAEIYARDELSLVSDIHYHVKVHVEGLHPLIFETVVLLGVELPPEMAKGIIDKLLAEQTLLTYGYRLRAEEQEKKRKAIEAEGIKAFEDISGVSMLKWRGIDATADLAKSPNAKIIIMGTGSNNLPLLLNADQPNTPASAPSASGTKK